MTPGLRHGLIDARHALGGAFIAVAASAAVICVTVAALLETPAAPGIVAGPHASSLIAAAAFGVALPLVSYGVTARIGTGLEVLMGAAWPRYGGDRRLYALGRLAFALAMTAVIVTASAAWGTVSSFALMPAAPAVTSPLAQQLVLGVAVALLGTCSYVACFAAAHSIAGNLGRALYLVGDWLLGSGVGVAAVPWPRAHLRALLGGSPVLGMTELQTIQLLLAISIFGALLFARRTPP